MTNIEKLVNRLTEEEAELMILMLEIQDMSPTGGWDVGWERKIVCPDCHTRALILRTESKYDSEYYCNECGSEGYLEDLYRDLLGVEISKPRGVTQ